MSLTHICTTCKIGWGKPAVTCILDTAYNLTGRLLLSLQNYQISHALTHMCKHTHACTHTHRCVCAHWAWINKPVIKMCNCECMNRLRTCFESTMISEAHDWHGGDKKKPKRTAHQRKEADPSPPWWKKPVHLRKMILGMSEKLGVEWWYNNPVSKTTLNFSVTTSEKPCVSVRLWIFVLL